MTHPYTHLLDQLAGRGGALEICRPPSESFLNITRLSWTIVLPLKMLRVSLRMVITMIVSNIIVMGGISWRAAGTWPGEGCLHGWKSRWWHCWVLHLDPVAVVGIRYQR